MSSAERLTAQQFQQAGGVEEWRVLGFGTSAWFDAPSHTAGAALARRIAELTGDAGRPPDIDLRAGGVHVRISTTAGLTQTDVTAARAISAAARDLGLSSRRRTHRVAIHALDASSPPPGAPPPTADRTGTAICP